MTTRTKINKKKGDLIVIDVYNYYEEVKEDVREALKDTDCRDFDNLYDGLYYSDSVTGYGSNSYTINKLKAEKNLNGNWNLLIDAIKDYGYDCNPIAKGAEWCDVMIRCYLLDSVLKDVLEELEEKQ